MTQLRLVEYDESDDAADAVLGPDEALALLDLVFLCPRELTAEQQKAVDALSRICRSSLREADRPALRLVKAA